MCELHFSLILLLFWLRLNVIRKVMPLPLFGAMFFVSWQLDPPQAKRRRLDTDYTYALGWYCATGYNTHLFCKYNQTDRR